MIPFDELWKLNRERQEQRLASQKKKRDRALKRMKETWNTLHRKCPRQAADVFWKALCTFQDIQGELALTQCGILFHKYLGEVPASSAGRKMFNAQKQRREIKSERNRAAWTTWQTWIDKEYQAHKWGFSFAQKKASEHFGVNIKTIKRRTTKPGHTD